MTRRTLLLLILGIICSIPSAFAQKSISQLEQQLHAEKSSEGKMKVLYKLITRYRSISADTMDLYVDQYFQLAEHSGSDSLLMEANYIKGQTEMMKGNTSEAISWMNTALEYTTESTGLRYKARIIGNLGLLHYFDEQYEPAIELILEAKAMSEEAGDQRSVGIATSTIGSIYFQWGKLDTAEVYYKKALEIKKELNNSLLMTTDIVNLGLIYQRLNKLDSALVYTNRALELAQSNNDVAGIIDIYGDLATLNMKLGNPEKASGYAAESLEMSKKYGSLTLIRDAYEVMYFVHDSLGNYEQALANYEQFKTYSDSVLNETSRVELINAREKYESDKKEQEIALLASENTIYKQRMIIITGSFILGFILLAAFMGRSITQKRKALELEEKERQITETKKQLAEEALNNERLKTRHIETELTNYALHIVEKNELLESIRTQINDIRFEVTNREVRKELASLEMKVFQNTALNNEKDELEKRVDQVCDGFFKGLTELHTDLTEREKRLAALVRMNLSSKEIATILGIETKSVTQSRYRLRKKLNLETDESLASYLKTIQFEGATSLPV